MNITLNEFNELIEGFIDRREMQGNDLMYAIHQGAILHNIAMFNPSEYPKRAPEFRVRELTDEEQEERIKRSLLQSLMNLDAMVNGGDEDLSTLESNGYKAGGDIQ